MEERIEDDDWSFISGVGSSYSLTQPELPYPFLPGNYFSGAGANPLEIDFDRLNLLTHETPSPSRLAASPFTLGCSVTNEGNYYPLQTLRVASAVRGQSYQNPSFISDHEFVRSLLPIERNSSCTTIDNGISRNGFCGFGDQDSSNRNGFKSAYDSVGFGTNPNPRSNFRVRSLAQLRGMLFLVAKDQDGSRFLQKKLAERNPEEIQMIFFELKDHILDLMVDKFGNYVVQKIFKFCNVEQITQLLCSLISNSRKLMATCMHENGTRAMQILLEHLTTAEQRSLLLSVMRHMTLTLSKSLNGHHVIQKCLRLFSNEENKHILNAIMENFLDIAMDKSGCCVIQHCLAHAQGEYQQRLLAEITANAFVLSEHSYGNYVVQFVLGMGIPADAIMDILAQLVGTFVSLSMNKYGSNVVEKCLKETQPKHSMIIIRELIDSPNFLMFLQDPYGNYVAQTALRVVKGPLREKMVSLILELYPFLHSHPHGKRVLAKTRSSRRHM